MPDESEDRAFCRQRGITMVDLKRRRFVAGMLNSLGRQLEQNEIDGFEINWCGEDTINYSVQQKRRLDMVVIDGHILERD